MNETDNNLLKESILDSIKEAIGIVPDYRVFDGTLIMHINSVFSTLFQLGVGTQPFRIRNKDAVWSDFLSSEDELDDVKTYMALHVKMIFDPPTSSYLLDSMERQIKEYQWRINVKVDPRKEELKA